MKAPSLGHPECLMKGGSNSNDDGIRMKMPFLLYSPPCTRLENQVGGLSM